MKAINLMSLFLLSLSGLSYGAAELNFKKIAKMPDGKVTLVCSVVGLNSRDKVYVITPPEESSELMAKEVVVLEQWIRGDQWTETSKPTLFIAKSRVEEDRQSHVGQGLKFSYTTVDANNESEEEKVLLQYLEESRVGVLALVGTYDINFNVTQGVQTADGVLIYNCDRKTSLEQ